MREWLWSRIPKCFLCVHAFPYFSHLFPAFPFLPLVCCHERLTERRMPIGLSMELLVGQKHNFHRVPTCRERNENGGRGFSATIKNAKYKRAIREPGF
jgi:hypothetical protein